MCPTSVGPPRARNHLSEGMWITALCHTMLVGELSAVRMAVSSVVEFVLGHSPDETFRVEVVDEFQKCHGL
jgi:hypothetical protein